jgi:hypothetical protein
MATEQLEDLLHRLKQISIAQLPYLPAGLLEQIILSLLGILMQMELELAMRQVLNQLFLKILLYMLNGD